MRNLWKWDMELVSSDVSGQIYPRSITAKIITCLITVWRLLQNKLGKSTPHNYNTVQGYRSQPRFGKLPRHVSVVQRPG